MDQVHSIKKKKDRTQRKFCVLFLWFFLRLLMGRDVLLNHGDDMLDGVLAIALEPLGNDAHQPLNVKRHQIPPIRFRNAVTVQNRRDHVLEKLGIAVVQPQGGGVLQAWRNSR